MFVSLFLKNIRLPIMYPTGIYSNDKTHAKVDFFRLQKEGLSELQLLSNVNTKQ